jgi:hypothetical protein
MTGPGGFPWGPFYLIPLPDRLARSMVLRLNSRTVMSRKGAIYPSTHSPLRGFASAGGRKKEGGEEEGGRTRKRSIPPTSPSLTAHSRRWCCRSACRSARRCLRACQCKSIEHPQEHSQRCRFPLSEPLLRKSYANGHQRIVPVPVEIGAAGPLVESYAARFLLAMGWLPSNPSERRSWSGRPRRITVSISSSPSWIEAETPGAS